MSLIEILNTFVQVFVNFFDGYLWHPLKIVTHVLVVTYFSQFKISSYLAMFTGDTFAYDAENNNKKKNLKKKKRSQGILLLFFASYVAFKA